ncbi:MAG: hypothetical protein ACO3N4_05380 [Ilumatobacteraceae bacterium]
MTTIAALYVSEDGPYVGLDGVDVWGVTRDARRYAGPHPVVAHPPCERWGRYWHGGPSAKVRRQLGDDGGCFAHALDSVRRFGGVLEHPEASHAWRAFGLARPPYHGGWVQADDHGGWTCCVAQGHYGHRARKMTWLYAVRTERPELTWGPSVGVRLDEGFHSREERRAARDAAKRAPRQRLSKRECWATPPAFLDVLVAMARSAQPAEEAAE